MHAIAVVVTTGLFASAALSQRAIATGFGPLQGGATGDTVAAGGDMDGDLVPDLLVGSPLTGIGGSIQLVSGATRTIRTVVGTVAAALGDNILLSPGDMNLDGADDFIADRAGGIVAFSGATGAVLWQTSGVNVTRAAPIGDIDNDGRADLAVSIYGGGSSTVVWRMSGVNGALLPGSLSLPNGVNLMVSLGDVTGDGIPELAIANGNSVDIAQVSNLQVLRTIPAQGMLMLGAGNLAGDARNELLACNSGNLFVHSATTGVLLRTITGCNGAFAVVGDLDADGWSDLALRFASGQGVGNGVDLRSGGSGRLLARWLGTSRLRCTNLAATGDVDGDGFGDLLIGDPVASINGSAGPQTGGWQLLSCKLLASVQTIPVQCTQGPWPPQLGMTRPILGQTLVIEGRDCPAAASGVLALSNQPALPYNFGVVGCDGWWDVGNWQMLHQTTGTSWQLQVPLPNIPQLAGFDVALQAFYLPTASPIGFDLSNALWARLGF